ncbi:reverse transcriptase [Corchorus capsularis]|uniref:Reverse transcriptase n=1 Tax=Corchorus capsularis TaxID=210143 RepID=A0A1R3I7Y1_COCAP|nr:reverse transcriptase [Corchorus capsularis]
MHMTSAKFFRRTSVSLESSSTLPEDLNETVHPNRNWSSVLMEDVGLKSISPVDPQKAVFRAPEEVYESSSAEWKHCILAQFLSFKELRIDFGGVMGKWEPGDTRMDIDLRKFPLWLTLKHVPIEPYTKLGLSFIASRFGTPLYMDRATAMKQKISTGKVCVEVDLEAKLLDKIAVELRDGTAVTIDVEIPWRPTQCSSCKVLGHTDCSLPKQAPKQRWTPKKASADQDIAATNTIIVDTHTVNIVQPTLTDSSSKSQTSGSKLSAADTGKTSTSKQSANRFTILQNVEAPDAISAPVIETRVKVINSAASLSRLFPGWNYFCNYDHAPNGRIWFVWKDCCQVDFIDSCAQCITCKVTSYGKQFYVSAVYGANFEIERKDLWNHLLHLSGVIDHAPWLVARDFNIIFTLEESSDYNGSQLPGSDVLAFTKCISQLDLVDHIYTGPLFTWWNKREEGSIFMKLDRALVNIDWFFNFWSEHDDFLAIVAQSWSQTVSGRNPMIKLFRKLKRLKIVLRQFNKDKFGQLSNHVHSKREEIAQLQNSILQYASPQLIVDMKVKELELKELSIAEEKILQDTVPEEMKQTLVAPITPDEIQKTLFSMSSDKAPGPDGFNAHFFKTAWSVVKQDVIETILHFFNTCDLLPAFNSTAITRVPKVPNPSYITEFRPIACCIIIYRCITKILANRMQPCLPFLIADNQYAFIKGRKLVDNVLLAQEIVCGYNRSNISPRCALKIDLRKAFDSVDWSFLVNILQAHDFPDVFINWLSNCFMTPHFSLSLNGGLIGYFAGARGVTGRSHLSLSLCPCYEYDLLIFTKGNADSITGIKSILNLFYSYSGLKLNCTKSELFTVGISVEHVQELQTLSQFKIGTLPVRYLGLPLVSRNLSEKDCGVLIKKIKQRISNWAVKYLTFAGRLQLIQSVLFSIQNFWCQSFMLPGAVIKKVNQLCSSFFWKGTSTNAKGARVSWDWISHPKSEGGLSLKNMTIWNQACILKHLWSIFVQSGSLWIAWIHAYILKGSNIMEIPSLQRYSWNMKKLLKLRVKAAYFIHNGDWSQSTYIYKISLIYNQLRHRQPHVSWHRLLWFSYNYPRHSLITWMVILDRLPTKDRLRQWNLQLDSMDCVLCGQHTDCRDHIFFTCDYSKKVWMKVLAACRLHRTVGNWHYEFQWALSKLKGKSLLSLILKLAWNAFCYVIWRERNRRLFQRQMQTVEQSFQCIVDAIRIRLLGLRNVVRDPVNDFLCKSRCLQLVW